MAPLEVPLGVVRGRPYTVRIQVPEHTGGIKAVVRKSARPTSRIVATFSVRRQGEDVVLTLSRAPAEGHWYLTGRVDGRQVTFARGPVVADIAGLPVGDGFVVGAQPVVSLEPDTPQDYADRAAAAMTLGVPLPIPR